VRELPALRPLTLTLKALLRGAGLNEVFWGGLSSYAVTLMVVAHLKVRGLAAVGMSCS
jgi:DNA polymerase sigma